MKIVSERRTGVEFFRGPDESPLSVSDWFITILILAIPIVGLVMLFVWGFSTSGNLHRKNYCIAMLIWLAIGLAFAIVFGMLGSFRIG